MHLSRGREISLSIDACFWISLSPSHKHSIERERDTPICMYREGERYLIAYASIKRERGASGDPRERGREGERDISICIY